MMRGERKFSLAPEGFSTIKYPSHPTIGRWIDLFVPWRDKRLRVSPSKMQKRKKGNKKECRDRKSVV